MASMSDVTLMYRPEEQVLAPLESIYPPDTDTSSMTQEMSCEAINRTISVDRQ